MRRNYVKGSIFLTNKEIKLYDPSGHVNEHYPPACLIGSEYGEDMIRLYDKLRETGADCILIDPELDRSETDVPHCYMTNGVSSDQDVREDFDRMTSFLIEHLD